MVFFRLPGPSKASYSMQLRGRQPQPPPLQIGINVKILKISPEWRRILIDEFFLYLFAEFQLHLSNSFRENRR